MIFQHEFRVYYGDTDAGGVMYHPNYADMFARARNEWCREVGLGIKVQESLGICFVIQKMSLEYHQPARLDDKVVVTTSLVKSNRAVFEFDQKMHRADDGVMLCTGVLKGVCVDITKLTPKRLDKSIYKEIIGE